MTSFTPEPWDYSHHPTQEIDVNTIDVDTSVIRKVSGVAVIALLGALALSYAIDTLAARADTTGAGALSSFGEYLTEVGEALGNG
jgi:hypothetical protein